VQFKLTGFSSKEIIGIKPPYPWWPPEKAKQYDREFVKNRFKSLRYGQRLFRKKNGELFWVEVTFSVLKDTEQKDFLLIATWIDITERKKAEDQLLAYQKELRSLASQLTLTEENERRNIANLIHDGVTQLLALCVMKMEVLMDSVPDPQVSGSLKDIYKIVQQAIEDTRTLTFELSPPSLYDLGLEAALEELTEKFGEQQDIHTDYEDDAQPKPLDNSTSVLMFQSVREILHNVSIHARAKQVMVRTKKVGNTIHVTVKDDGVGFNPGDLKENPRDPVEFGLFSIRERLQNLGGHLQIKSSPGKGSRLTLIAPLKVEKET
jgi:PAS domain S-box-containing protein